MDEEAKEVVVNVVNDTGKMNSMNIVLDHATKIEGATEISRSGNDGNFFAHPTRFVPVSETIKVDPADFVFPFKPGSVTIPRI